MLQLLLDHDVQLICDPHHEFPPPIQRVRQSGDVRRVRVHFPWCGAEDQHAPPSGVEPRHQQTRIHSGDHCVLHRMVQIVPDEVQVPGDDVIGEGVGRGGEGREGEQGELAVDHGGETGQDGSGGEGSVSEEGESGLGGVCRGERGDGGGVQQGAVREERRIWKDSEGSVKTKR